MRRPKRSQRVEGSVVNIDLGDGNRTYARVLREPLIEFFDLNTPNDLEIEKILEAPVLFRINVMNEAVESGRWPIVGSSPLSPQEASRVEYFCKQDSISGNLSIYWEDATSGVSHERPATFEECTALEPVAVWDANHVEDRLRDHFRGVPNKWVESLRPRRA